MARFVLVLAMASMLGACATTTTTDAGKSGNSTASTSAEDKRCMRVQQTGSNMSQRRCASEGGR